MAERSSLVAGGAGFLGSHLCGSLLEDGHQVYCLDNESSGRFENIDSFRDQDEFNYIKGILCTVESSSKITHEQLPKNDPERRQPDIAKANTLLKWWPKIELDDGVNRTIRYFNSST